MHKLILALGFSLFVVSTTVAQKPLKVFVLAGQSNMVGQGQSDELPEQQRSGPENVHMLGQNGRLLPLRVQGRFGPELSFAREMAQAFPDDTIVLVKHAKGGTSALAWSPEWTAEKAKSTQNEGSGQLYDALLKRIQALKEKQNVEIVGMIWAQGGRDAKYEESAQQYEQNLKAIITAIRKDLNQPNLPFVLARTPDLPTSRFPHVDAVRKAQEAVAVSVPHTKIILTDDLSQRGDDTHFDTEGQLEQGRRFAKALKELLADKATKNP